MFNLMNLHEYSYTTSILVSKENIPFVPEAPLFYPRDGTTKYHAGFEH